MSETDGAWVPKKPKRFKGKPSSFDYDTPTEDDHPTSPDTHREAGAKKGWVLTYVMPVILAVLTVFLVQYFFIQPFSIPSESMVPTLQVNDRIVVLKPLKNFKRGDVVVFEKPAEWTFDSAGSTIFATQTDDQFLVKRIIGLPGDTVQCCSPSGDIILNGVPYSEPYTADGTSGSTEFNIVVPENSYFVMGDNREYSADSRSNLTFNNGAIPADSIVGEVVLRIWPFNTAGRFPDVIYEE